MPKSCLQHVKSHYCPACLCCALCDPGVHPETQLACHGQENHAPVKRLIREANKKNSNAVFTAADFKDNHLVSINNASLMSGSSSNGDSLSSAFTPNPRTLRKRKQRTTLSIKKQHDN
jgi:hypothetical protein